MALSQASWEVNGFHDGIEWLLPNTLPGPSLNCLNTCTEFPSHPTLCNAVMPWWKAVKKAPLYSLPHLPTDIQTTPGQRGLERNVSTTWGRGALLLRNQHAPIFWTQIGRTHLPFRISWFVAQIWIWALSKKVYGTSSYQCLNKPWCWVHGWVLTLPHLFLICP